MIDPYTNKHYFMDSNLLIHAIASVLALISGGFIFLTPKGTVKHKKLGYTYTGAMLVLLITSFFIFDLFGQFGIYHTLSLVSFATLAIALSFPLFFRSKSNWVEHHMIWMGYSYVGLIMAGGSHMFQLFPDWSGSLRMVLFCGLPYAIGSYLIITNRKTAVQKAIGNMEKK